MGECELTRGTAARVGGAESEAARGPTMAAQWGTAQVVELTDGVRLSAVMRPSPLQIAERMAALLTAMMAFARREGVADVLAAASRSKLPIMSFSRQLQHMLATVCAGCMWRSMNVVHADATGEMKMPAWEPMY